MRGGLWSSSSVPGAGILIRVDPNCDPGHRPATLIGVVGVACADPQNSPAWNCWSGVRPEKSTMESVGAQAGGVLAMIVGEGMGVVGAGVVVGTALGVGGARVVRHLLFGSAESDAVFYVGAALLVTLVGLVACWLPARRAAAIEPVIALRQD